MQGGSTFGFRSLAVMLLAAVLIAGSYATVSFNELLFRARAEREALAVMTHSFTHAYSENRSEDSIVPAEFRRKALDYFNATSAIADGTGQSRLSLNMVGVPGYEIARTVSDSDTAAIISGLTSASAALHRLRIQPEGTIIDQTIIPAPAHSQECATCHNEISDARDWQVGDVMGATVIEGDITGATVNIFGRAIVAGFLAALLVALAIRRERVRNQRIIDALGARLDAQRKQADAEKKARMARSDELTGLGNRMVFREEAKALLAEGDQTLLVLMDLDDFKATNDRFGHLVGDRLLARQARRLKDVVSEFNGRAYRLGGDEFAALIKPQSGDCFSFDELGRCLVEAIREPVKLADTELFPRASFGLACQSVVGTKGLEELTRAADFALYCSKSSGRNTYTIYDQDLKDRMDAERELLAEISMAVAQREFIVQFQPQFDLGSGRLHGFEALVRWERAGELISPDIFIHLLEQTGQIRDVDIQVLDLALAELASWLSLGGEPISISVNFSAVNFKHVSMVDAIREALERHKVPSHCVIIEITESLLLDDWDRVSGILSDLKALGLRISLDDFGTGYSSLAYLRKLNVDQIKIDREFVNDLEHSMETSFILDGVLDIAEGIGLTVVVEGIETERQRDELVAMGATIGQGYLLGRPMSPADAARLVEEEMAGEPRLEAAGR